METMRAFWLLGVLFIGCGGDSSGGGGALEAGAPDRAVAKTEAGKEGAAREAGHVGHDAGHEAAADAAHEASGVPGYPASHPSMPQEQKGPGPIMKSPKFVIITFAGDALAPSIDDFVDKVAASATYWSGTTAEYGVGPVSSVLDITVTDTPAANLADSDVQAWLTGKLSGPDAGTLDGGAPWPQPDGETLYMIYYPDGVTGARRAAGDELRPVLRLRRLRAHRQHVRHVQRRGAVPAVPRDDRRSTPSRPSASHELITEAATDPEPTGQPRVGRTPTSSGLAQAVACGRRARGHVRRLRRRLLQAAGCPVPGAALVVEQGRRRRDPRSLASLMERCRTSTPPRSSPRT